jgi:succinyl-CoA synthetase beta subunit
MKLLEYQGKELFSRYGIPIPPGALWPNHPKELKAVAIKAQVPAGGRGKAGGIEFVDDAAAIEVGARKMLGQALGDHLIEQILIEERLDIERELYLAVVIDRDAKCRTILTSAQGGMDIESVPKKDILRLPIEASAEIQASTIEQVTSFLDLTEMTAVSVASILEALCRLAHEQDAEVAEINPLAVIRDGSTVAADAKIVLDDRARFRHPEWEQLDTSPEQTPFELAIGEHRGYAIDVDPNGLVVAIIGGAGAMMATFDRLIDLGVPMRAVVDLGGTAMYGAAGMTPIFQAVADLKTPIIFFSTFFQTSRCDLVAQGIAEACAQAAPKSRLLARLEGNSGERGREILSEIGFEVNEKIEHALNAVATACKEIG